MQQIAAPSDDICGLCERYVQKQTALSRNRYEIQNYVLLQSEAISSYHHYLLSLWMCDNDNEIIIRFDVKMCEVNED